MIRITKNCQIISNNFLKTNRNLFFQLISYQHKEAYLGNRQKKQLICSRDVNKNYSLLHAPRYLISDQKTKQYDKTGQQGDSKNVSNTPTKADQQKSVKFISRLKNYSDFLSKKTNQKPNKILSFLSQQENLIKSVNDYFQQAGTNVQQISVSLAQIAKKLQIMLKQSQILYKQHQGNDSQKYQKYQRRYEQFISLMKKLDEKYYKQIDFSSVKPIQTALYLLDLQTQMTTLIQLLYGATQQTNPHFKFTQDITNDDAFSKKFKYAWDKVKLIQLDPTTKAKHDIVYGLLRKSVVMVTNAVVTQHTWSTWTNQYWKKLLFGMSFPVSLIDLQKAELACYKVWRRPNIKMVKNLLDLPEQGYIQHAKKFIYPGIRSNFFLYNHSATKSTAENKETVNSKQVSAQQTDSNIFDKAQNSGRILLLSHQNLQFKKQRPTQKFGLINKIFDFGISKTKQSKQKQKQTIIIHMHGGGFISMSSQLMQNHTRKWANQLQVPVFSLDYRKPPTHRFPEPLQDCVAGYKFIVEKISQYMNIQPKNIILAGDSAGGNMACALQAYLMKQKYPILPKALFLMYPAVDLRVRYTPSRLRSFSDGIFLPSLLLLCQQQYLGKQRKNQFDPLASPILLTQAYMNPQKQGTQQGKKWPQKWPKTVMMSGRKDPLFDDSIRLLQRLTKDNIESKLLLYKDFSHGFMSMDQVLPGCKQAIDDSIKQLKEIIKNF